MAVVPDIMEEDALYKFMNIYDKWDDSPNTSVVDNDTGGSHTFTAVNTSGSINKFIKPNFLIGKRQS